ncbi:MAG: transketolase, partial [Spirochaeta sp.]
MNPQTETFLKNKAHQMRIHSIRMTSAAGSGHPTSCLSAAEIMSVLFFYQMKYDPVHLHSLDNDAFIMSKGHAAPILYAAWAEAGSLPVSELKSLRNFDSPLEGHPVPRLPGVHAATGSLGQGLSMGAGIALALQQDKKKQRAYVLLGDGEMAEGNIWEAMNFASYYKLNNLCAVLDLNRLGQSEPTMFEWDTKVYEDRARAFGWEPVVVDGHSISELVNGFEQAQKSDKP